MTKQELIKRLEPYAQGCLSGKVAEWPQLNPLLRDIYNYLKGGPILAGRTCYLCGYKHGECKCHPNMVP